MNAIGIAGYNMRQETGGTSPMLRAGFSHNDLSVIQHTMDSTRCFSQISAATPGGLEGTRRTASSRCCIQFKGGQSADGGLGLEFECCQTIQSGMSALEPTLMQWA